MGDVFNDLLQFVSQWGIYVAGIAALISYLSEVYSGLRRTGPPDAWANAKIVVRLAITMVSVAVAFFVVSEQYEKKSPAARAAQNIIEDYHDCLSVGDTLGRTDTKRIDDSSRPIVLQCLAMAVGRDAPDHASTEPSAALAEDVELGHRLLADSGDRNIADTLYDYFGIHKDTFLGTGYSVPRGSVDETDPYSGALVREFLVPNYCAETMLPRCPSRQDSVWAWAIDPHRINELSVRDVLLRQAPRDGAEAFARQWAARRQADTSGGPWLIRFSVFPSKRYLGTVGRAKPVNAAYVFFSDLDQMQRLSLREALRRSGSTTKDMDNQDPGRAVFVWVVAPAEDDEYTKLATWHSILGLLKKIEIDDRLARAIAARPPSLLRRLE